MNNRTQALQKLHSLPRGLIRYSPQCKAWGGGYAV